ARAEFDVVLDLEIEVARRAPAADLDAVLLAATAGHRSVREVGHAQRDRLDLGAERVQPRLTGVQLDTEAGTFRPQRRHTPAPTLCLPDRLAARVAQVLHLLRADLDLLAFGLQ